MTMTRRKKKRKERRSEKRRNEWKQVCVNARRKCRSRCPALWENVTRSGNSTNVMKLSNTSRLSLLTWLVGNLHKHQHNPINVASHNLTKLRDQCISPTHVLFHMWFLQVRNAEASWGDTRKQLRKDHRWDLAELLEREEKEKLFEEHIEELHKKNKEMFHKLLEETSDVSIQYLLWHCGCFNFIFYCDGSCP